jgi:hypothetical protein
VSLVFPLGLIWYLLYLVSPLFSVEIPGEAFAVMWVCNVGKLCVCTLYVGGWGYGGNVTYVTDVTLYLQQTRPPRGEHPAA